MSEERPWCEVRHLRAKDLTDRDVIRFRGTWREVLEAHADEDDIRAIYGASIDTIDVPNTDHRGYELTPRTIAVLMEEAFDRIMPTYVLIRLWIHENSRDEVEDLWVRLYRNELIEVQSLPAWTNPPEEQHESVVA